MTGSQPQVPRQKQGSRTGTIAFVAIGLAVAIGFVGMLAFKGMTGRYPWARAASEVGPTTKPVPDDVCGFIGETTMQKAVPNAELTNDPGSVDIPATCRARDPDGGAEVVVNVRRFEDAAIGTAPVRARSWFESFCAGAYSGTWALDDPSAPPAPVVGQRVCGDSGNPTTLVVLQERNVVDVSFTGWDRPERSALPAKATELARHVLQRLETLD